MSHDNGGGIAIVGIACRFPGSPNHGAFWNNLCAGVESITPLSDDDLIRSGVPPELFRDPAYVKAAALLPDIDQFDAAFFEYSPEETRLMDPQQRLLLEVGWEAFEDAGEPVGRAARPVGVFTGLGGVVSSYLVDRLPYADQLPGYTGSLAHLGNDKDFASTRISYKFNLTGPSINVQTACSTSLVAVHLACQSILAGECDMAIAGTATIRVPQRVGYKSIKGGILSPDGHCRAFDADAQGTIFGSGVAAVVLKDLAAALADGNHIYAVIRGSAINNDGADKVSYTASSVAGQAQAIVEALQIAEVPPEEISYVECHGTGTAVGDPLELGALTSAFRTGTNKTAYSAIGSVKTNIGHLEQTAGLAGLIKAALSLKHARIPPSLNFRRPNPKIDFPATPFFVNIQCREWPANGRARFAAVNSLGLGGTNVFMVLQEPPAAPNTAEQDGLGVFAISAKTDAALQTSITRHRQWLSDAEAPLTDICFTSTGGRMHFPKRFAAVVDSKRQLEEALRASADRLPHAGERRLAFLFSGQASQYPRMGAALYRSQPIFRNEIDRCAEIIGDRLEHSLQDVLFAEPKNQNLIDETLYTQPALFAVQAGLIAFWRALGIVPDAVLGHSIGEFAAAYCADVYTLEQALDLVLQRARLMQDLPKDGAMAAVFANAAAVSDAIEQLGNADVAIAALNGAENTVISGGRESITHLMRRFESGGIRCQSLNVSHAFHSPLIQPVIPELGRIAKIAPGKTPTIPWLSTVTGTPAETSPGPQYWCEHALNAVRFSDAVLALDRAGASDFVEIGPGNALIALGQTIVKKGNERSWLSSLDKRDELRGITESAAALYRRGFDLNWQALNHSVAPRRVSMPTYPFEHQRFWLDGDGPRQPNDPLPNTLTGVRLRSPLPNVQFESIYSLSRFPYLKDHRIYGMAVLPTTVGLTALRDAARQYFGSECVELGNLQYRQAMILPESGERAVQLIFTLLNDATAEVRLASTDRHDDDSWHTHMIGLARRQSLQAHNENAPSSLEDIKKRCAKSIPIGRYYKTIRALGLDYGPSFRGIQKLQRGNGEVLTRVKLPQAVAGDGQFGLHPALLDACLHLYPALVDSHGDFGRAPKESRHVHLPVGIERFDCADMHAQDVWAHGIRRQSISNDSESFVADIFIYGDSGNLVAAIEGLSVKVLPPEALTVQSPSIQPMPVAFEQATPHVEGEKSREWFIGLVRNAAMKTLGIIEMIDPARPLRELGLDSLMSLTLANRLESALGVEVSAIQLIQGPSIEQIVDELLPNLTETKVQTELEDIEPEPEFLSGASPLTEDDIRSAVAQSATHGWENADDVPTQADLSHMPAAAPSDSHSGKWMNVVGPRPAPQRRLFCFPFAGGGSAIYQNWPNFIDPAIEVIAVEPPGRLGRITEQPIADMSTFTDQLLGEMDPYLDRPFVFFGHCLGALTMYEAARRLIHTDRARPGHLFVSAARPPDRIGDCGLFEEDLMQDLLKLTNYRIGLPIYAQEDDVFAEVIRHFNIEATDQFLRDPDLQQLMLPVVRAEFKMASNYTFVAEPPWAIPITCFAAKGDPYVSREHALGWGRFTNARLQVHIRDGAHFGVVDDTAFIHSVINGEMDNWALPSLGHGGRTPW
jgi:acyl transferase domain-containing protein/surfactin synthase thioesterase subunit